MVVLRRAVSCLVIAPDAECSGLIRLASSVDCPDGPRRQLILITIIITIIIAIIITIIRIRIKIRRIIRITLRII